MYLEDVITQNEVFENYHNWGIDEDNNQLCFLLNTYYECEHEEFFSLEECESSCSVECEEDTGFIRCYDYSVDDETGVITTIYPGTFPGGTECLMNVYTPIENSDDLSVDALDVPVSFNLSKVYPNPFNPTTNISFSVPEISNVLLEVYDINGHIIRELTNNLYLQGVYTVSWNASDYPSGMYFVRMVSGGFMDIQKVMLIK